MKWIMKIDIVDVLEDIFLVKSQTASTPYDTFDTLSYSACQLPDQHLKTINFPFSKKKNNENT